MRVLDLFSGIGGFSLGLERTGGFETVAFCEIEPYCQKVLAKHWPGVPIYDDIRELTANTLARDGIAVDVICGGFPCQDLSYAGKRTGLGGKRSGLWGEYRRIIGELRPRYVIVENVPGLLSLGMGTVLGDLAALGYDATWHCIPASAVGARHRRDRVWVIAYADCKSKYVSPIHAKMAKPSEFISNTNSNHKHGRCGFMQMGRQRRAGEAQNDGHTIGNEWGTEPAVGRVAHGVPSRVDRLKALGNAVVPQIPELIGRAILNAEN